MRIIFAHSVSDLYGASRSLLRLSSRLAMDGHSVLVVLRNEGPLARELEASGVRLLIHPELTVIDRRSIKAPSIASLLRSVKWLRRTFLAFRPDIVHTNTSLILSPAIAAKITGISHVWHIREIFTDYAKIWPLYQWCICGLSRQVICVSEAVADQFYPRTLKPRVCVLHNGFPLHEFDRVSLERTRNFRTQFGLNGHPVVGLVGRIKIGRKGQDVFVKAAQRIVSKFPDVRFLCIGSPFPGNEAHGEQLLRLIEDAGMKNQVVCTGDVEDIKSAFAALDISIVPSVLPESFSGAVIESMALGKPVIGTRIGGTIEQIEDGVTGFVVEPGDDVSLATALDRLLSDSELREWMGDNARQRFVSKFEFTAFYESMLSIYNAIISNKGQRTKRDRDDRLTE